MPVQNVYNNKRNFTQIAIKNVTMHCAIEGWCGDGLLGGGGGGGGGTTKLRKIGRVKIAESIIDNVKACLER